MTKEDKEDGIDKGRENTKNTLIDKYIELMEETQAQKTESAALYEIYRKTNYLFQYVSTAPELRLDAHVSGEIVNLATSKLEKQCTGAILTADQFIQFITTSEDKHMDYIDKYFLGTSIPRELHLQGPEKPKRKRTAQPLEENQKLENTTTQQPTYLQQIDSLERVKQIYKVLQDVRQIELFRLVINPNSFSKTVENILFLSFAVKLERVYLSIYNQTIYVTAEQDKPNDTSHLIISITQEEAQEAIEQLKISTPML
ncbi:non-structural maintenance of chromosomes element 4 [Nematocida sp. AWRm80]|nr:non-structural maintenance of chromosomes element 4 [Nematocida sp. AWRm80]